jgi:hypothetical protein
MNLTQLPEWLPAVSTHYEWTEHPVATVRTWDGPEAGHANDENE